MKHFLSAVIASIMILPCALGWQYPTEFFPEQQTTHDWVVLRHPNAEFYIVRLPTMQEVQKYRRNRADFFGKVTPVMLGPYMSYDLQFPTTMFTFMKGDSQGDHYEVTLDAEVFPNAEKKKIVYSGSSIEVWKNENFLVGMRLSEETK